jgi:hypothetical protein
MKKVTLNTANKKKLELKKTAIANLQMSEEQMRVLIGGVGNKQDPTSILDCTHSETLAQRTI